jgi:radical SAM superfamily enzyme YgiQ (UPF0313 family)
MNILFINPPTLFELSGNNPQIIESERGFNPPLGLLFVASYLKTKSNHIIKVIDTQVEELDYKKLSEKLKNEKFDIVGITVTTFTLTDVIKTIEVVKNTNKNAKIVLGGPHITIYPEESLKLKNVDYCVIGEGEISFYNLVKKLESGEKPFNVKGIVFKDEEKIINNGFSPPITNLDFIPFPDRTLTPYKKYSSLLAKRTPITTMFTSRGCPFKCSFCNRPAVGNKFRAMSAKRVIEEMEMCLELGIHEFLIYDDTFTINKKRVKDICNLIIEKKLDVGFDIRARVDTLNEELLKLLKKAGCRSIHYGIESGTEKILKILRKDISIDNAKYIFELTRKEKIQTLAYFMIGNPTETKDDILQSFKVMKLLKPDFVHLTILSPFPATQVYSDALNEGIIEEDVWLNFAKNPSELFTPPYWSENFSKEELNALLVTGYKSFYLRPTYIIKRIMELKSFGEFFRKAKAGLKVVLMNKKGK